MSTQINDGGAAFPGGVNSVYTNITEGEPTQVGMTLRDYFAAKAMQAEMITTFSDATPASASNFANAAGAAGRDPVDHLAHNAYEVADAMLRAREVQA